MELGARVHSLSSKWCYQFCCATKMPTASEARELDAYGDRSNRSLGRTPVQPTLILYTKLSQP